MDGRPITDPPYLAEMAEFDRITAQAERDMPWHDPADGLRTVRALIAALEIRPGLRPPVPRCRPDLQAYRFAVEYARTRRTRFYLAAD